MTKIANHFYITGLCMLFFSAFPGLTYAQKIPFNKYGLLVINDKTRYRESIKNNALKKMEDVKILADIILDLRYAADNNFMHEQIYPNLHTTYLRNAAITALRQVQVELKEKGLGLKIFDAYRPYAATEKMWEIVKDNRYAADPKNGSGHNRGVAVDLTIVDMSTGRPLDMGTDFDNFTDSAHHGFKDFPSQVIDNRLLLKNLMEKYGFKALETEWWHYSLPNSKEYELLNLSFKTLRKLAN